LILGTQSGIVEQFVRFGDEKYCWPRSGYSPRGRGAANPRALDWESGFVFLDVGVREGHGRAEHLILNQQTISYSMSGGRSMWLEPTDAF
jgi:hypothetical protein